MRRAMAALLLATIITACRPHADNAGQETPRSFVAEQPQGRTFDNPFNIGPHETVEVPVDESPEAQPKPDPGSNITDIGIDNARTTGTLPTPSVPVSSSPGEAGSCNDGKRLCGDMTSCEDARFHLQQCGMHRLDGDGDGTPCEKICG